MDREGKEGIKAWGVYGLGSSMDLCATVFLHLQLDTPTKVVTPSGHGKACELVKVRKPLRAIYGGIALCRAHRSFTAMLHLSLPAFD